MDMQHLPSQCGLNAEHITTSGSLQQLRSSFSSFSCFGSAWDTSRCACSFAKYRFHLDSKTIGYNPHQPTYWIQDVAFASIAMSSSFSEEHLSSNKRGAVAAWCLGYSDTKWPYQVALSWGWAQSGWEANFPQTWTAQPERSSFSLQPTTRAITGPSQESASIWRCSLLRPQCCMVNWWISRSVSLLSFWPCRCIAKDLLRASSRMQLKAWTALQM